MPASPYFDGCYFDPAYFDAAPCVVATGGKLWKRRPVPVFIATDEENQDEVAVILLLSG